MTNTLTVDPCLTQALDLLLDKMKADNFPFSRVAALSGTGQVKLMKLQATSDVL